MKSAGKARNNGLYRHIRTSKEIIRNLLNDYEYKLDVSRQKCIYPETIPLDIGLKEAARWYDEHEKEINKKPYISYIEANFPK